MHLCDFKTSSIFNWIYIAILGNYLPNYYYTICNTKFVTDTNFKALHSPSSMNNIHIIIITIYNYYVHSYKDQKYLKVSRFQRNKVLILYSTLL